MPPIRTHRLDPCSPSLLSPRRHEARPHGPQHDCLRMCVHEVQTRPTAACSGIALLADATAAGGSGISLLREYVVQTFTVWPARALEP